ncbi:MAG: hypothetical protein CR967_06030 [Proteobacteria bacterium]|nr:MAG: hypothetical protein CR967_06030 [Pseudomonadota bacterium]
MKILKYVSLFAASMLLVGCTSTVSNNRLSTLNSNDIEWPDLDSAFQDEGVFPNMENLSKIGKGVSKDELYYLIGTPHFSALYGADEWDYIMKFLKDDGSVKVCQYKIYFDDGLVEDTFWNPDNCLQSLKEVKQTVVPAPVVVPTEVVEEPAVQSFSLSADALFPSGKGSQASMKQAGKNQLDDLAAQFLESGSNAKIHLIGHTDFRGSKQYNMELSKKRALSVKQYLISQGVSPSDIFADWRGESEPVADCPNITNKKELIDCLQPNRRVDIEIY